MIASEEIVTAAPVTVRTSLAVVPKEVRVGVSVPPEELTTTAALKT